MKKLQGENTVIDIFGSNDKYIPTPQKKKSFEKHKPVKRLPRTKWKKTRDRLKSTAQYGSPMKRFAPQAILVPHKNSLQIDFHETRQVIPTVVPTPLKFKESKTPLPPDTSHPLKEEDYRFKNRFDYPLDKRQIEQLKLGLLQNPHDGQLRDITERIRAQIDKYTGKSTKVLNPRLVQVKPRIEEEEKRDLEERYSPVKSMEYLNTEAFGLLPKRGKAEALQRIIDRHALDVPRKSLSSVRKALRDMLD